METTDWKVLINTRECWDTQSKRTARQPVFQSHEVEQQWLQTLQASSPCCCSQVSTGKPRAQALQLSSSLRFLVKGRCIRSTWNPRLSSLLISFQKIKITYAGCCSLLQLGHGSPSQASALCLHPLPNSWGALALNLQEPISKPQALLTVSQRLLEMLENYCYYQLCWKYTSFSFL